MQLLGALVLLSAGVVYGRSPVPPEYEVCYRDVTQEVSRATLDFNLQLFKTSANYYNNHFVLAPYSIWMTLAALAEGAAGSARERLFNVLNLPREQCVRQNYYKALKHHERPCSDVKLFRNRLFGYDECLYLNETWSIDVHNNGLLDTLSLPILSDPEFAVDRLTYYSKAPLEDLCLTSNSVLVDTLDYFGFWSSAFPNAKIEHDAPFYNEAGVSIGKVDYIHTKRLARFGYSPESRMKIVEIPVDLKGTYSLFLHLPDDYVPLKAPIAGLSASLVEQNYRNMRDSLVPVEIVLPRIKLTSYHEDLPLFLNQVGLTGLFTDPATTEYISEPPALPGAYVQRIAVNLGVSGEDYREEEEDEDCSDLETGLPEQFGNTLYINKPFYFVFQNTKSKISLFSGAYSRPDDA